MFAKLINLCEVNHFHIRFNHDFSVLFVYAFCILLFMKAAIVGGFGSFNNERIQATPSAPCSMGRLQFSALIPPIAMHGI
mmetsp:Transcript_63821/g.74749  ORF Transcript_63821/g.74749 Transcript_63821/m.74749 type:complete len:80 (+) Transcript_63821:246-485(+)